MALFIPVSQVEGDKVYPEFLMNLDHIQMISPVAALCGGKPTVRLYEASPGEGSYHILGSLDEIKEKIRAARTELRDESN